MSLFWSIALGIPLGLTITFILYLLFMRWYWNH